jgi:hypothetical protein
LGILCSNPLDNVSSRIIAIDLDGVEYDGFLTPSIGNLSELTIFNLGKNKFRRIIPETIANLKKLTMLSLADNYFTGTIPNEITLLKNLECLDIFGNKIYGSVPVNIYLWITKRVRQRAHRHNPKPHSAVAAQDFRPQRRPVLWISPKSSFQIDNTLSKPQQTFKPHFISQKAQKPCTARCE